MADETVITSPEASAAAPPAASPDGHKRKHEDLELNNAPEPLNETDAKSDPDSLNNGVQKEENGGADESEAKRPRLESNGDNVSEADGLVSHNGHQENKTEDEPEEEDPDEEVPELPESAGGNGQPMEDQEPAKESSETIVGEPASVENDKTEIGSADELGQQNTEVEESSEQKTEVEEPSELPREGDVPVETQPGSGTEILSRKMEVPSDKVGVLIGKGGDTIRSLQDNSGAKIQITRDADADPRSTSRPVELVGTLENINKAEKLIKDVIAEADAGGSPSLVARGFNTAQAASGGEQIEIQVSYEKVGLIIGKGGETIRNLQTRSGARIQLIQPTLSDGGQSKDRTIRVTGNKKQIETAREMIKDVMNQNVRQSPLSGGYGQQGYRPRGPVASQWGSRGPHHGQYSSYDYPQRGTYPSQNSQYPQPSYGNYPPPQAPRSNFGPSWEQRPPASMHGPPPQGNYNNYGQQPPPYSQTSAQPYGGHGYNEVNKYDNHSSSQHYGHMGSQPTPYAQGGAHSGYGPQDQYGKPPPPMYNTMPPQQAPHSQPYGQPRPSQPGEVPYQGPVSAAAQPYGQNMPPQQPYPYASSGYPSSYGSAQPTSDGYSSHTPAATSASASGYPPHQAVAGYGSQQAYPQPGPTAGYGSYPTTAQPGYAEQPAASNAGYGYGAPAADPAYGAPAAAPSSYGQTQPSYDQSAGGYGNVPAAAAAPAGYGKSTSPQTAAYPQYDSSQMYGAHR